MLSESGGAGFVSRGPVARSDAIDEQLPGSLVTLARIDIAAQNHAAVEGAADPFPQPRARTDPPANIHSQATPRGRVAKLSTTVPSAYYGSANRLDDTGKTGGA